MYRANQEISNYGSSLINILSINTLSNAIMLLIKWECPTFTNYHIKSRLWKSGFFLHLFLHHFSPVHGGIEAHLSEKLLSNDLWTFWIHYMKVLNLQKNSHPLPNSIQYRSFQSYLPNIITCFVKQRAVQPVKEWHMQMLNCNFNFQ